MTRRLAAHAASALVLAAAATPALAQVPSDVTVLGQTVEGRLEAGDWRDEEGYVADVWRFMANAGTRVEVVMRSEGFDTYLVAGRQGAGGWEEIGRDDDGLGEGLNSRLRFVAAETGEYVVRARGYSPEAQGSYALTLTDRGPAPALPPAGSLVAGAEVSGVLESGDAETDEGERYDAYRFRAAAGDRLQAVVRSGEFDTVLEVGRTDAWGRWESLGYDDDGLGEGLNSRLNFTAPEAGEYELRVGAFGGAGQGAYALSLTDRGPLPPPPPPQPLALGGQVEGELDDEDAFTEQPDWGGAHYHEDYLVRARRGQRLGVSLDSDDFDALVRVGRVGRDGAFEELASNDDGMGADLNSRLLFVPPADGEYVVRATSFGTESFGGYALRVIDLGREPRAATLTPGREVRGSLAEGDAITFSGGRYDLYRFTARAGDRLILAAESADFDTVIDVLQPDGDGGYFLVASDDDGAGEDSTDSRLVFQPQEDGEYHLWVRSYGPEERGAYRLRLTDMGPEPEPRPLALGSVVTGELAEGDAVAGDGSWFDAWRIRLSAGQRLRAVMRSGDFDTYLLLGQESEYGLEGLAEDDDGLGEGTDSRLDFTAPEDGDYVLWANSFGPGETGAYQLELIDLGPAPEPGSLVIGATVRGELTSDDPVTANGVHYDAFRFQAREGQTVRITLTSNAFDAFVEFGRRGPGGRFELIDSDDDGLSDLNSRLDVTIPADGEYLVRARSYAPQSTGAYVLTVEDAPEAE